jgi:hypothetical protein
MGKRTRERKLAKVEQAQRERALIQQRRQERLLPTLRLARRVAFTVFLTVLVLWIGVVMSGRLNNLVAVLGATT